MRRTTLLGASLLFAATMAVAQKPMKAPQGGKAISDHLIGIFFEDISSSADGGINAQLVQNGSFEYNLTEQPGWGPSTAWAMLREGHSTGYVQTLQKDPIHPNNPNYMQLYIERVKELSDYNGWKGVGLQNFGFDGISLRAGAKYDFSVFMRNADGKAKEIRVALVNPEAGMDILAETTLRTEGNDWKKLEATLTSKADCPTAKLRVLCLTEGVLDVDVVSLIPQDTYKGHGLRRDLIEALQAIHPHFMRFPGGCVIHGGGEGMWNTYRWKNTVGPREQRKPLKNTWGYHQSMEVGYYEYFQLCEDLGMEPVPILPCGVSCQGAGGAWGLPEQAQIAAPMDEMDEWLADAMDLIEWANGDASTKWGKVRAEAGHPEPFNLKYLGLGNEERITPEYCERFRYLYERITKAHPEIIIIGPNDPGTQDEFCPTEGWKLADELGMPLIDEHYYSPKEYFQNCRKYDGYSRDRKTRVYLGEYASLDCKFINALSEALYLMHVERNADMVEMTSYAPLFGRANATNWNPDLIYYDNDRVFLTTDYYVQQMFGLSSGQYYYGDCVRMERPDDNLVGQSVILNTKTRTLYVKMCNASDKACKATLNLARFPGLKAQAEQILLTGDPEAKNDANGQPIKPQTQQVTMKKKMEVELAPYSFVMYTCSLK